MNAPNPGSRQAPQGGARNLGAAPRFLENNKNAHRQPALWEQLLSASAVLAAVRKGQSTTVALEGVPPVLRPGVQALIFAGLRALARAEFLRNQLVRRPPAPRVDALLCLALALAWRDEGAPYDSFTLVNQAVEAAKREPSLRAQAAFINACLRRFLRERAAFVASSEQDDVVRWNHPAWWIHRLRQDHPDAWQDILRADGQAAPLQLRVNTRRQSVSDYLRRLADAGIAAHATGAHGIQLTRAVPVQALPGFSDGAVSVQDAAAQRAAPLLIEGLGAAAQSSTGRPTRILDACAAPGGKTAHLLEISDARVIALEIDHARSVRIAETLERLELRERADVIVGDAARPDGWWDGLLFDAILLDAPCTASGIVRRHPDVPWLRRASDVEQLANTQRTMLRTLWPLLTPGGVLLYCTCSVFRAEGSAQLQAFLEHNTDARLAPSPGHLLPSSGAKPGPVPDNPGSDHDGFFYALLRKERATDAAAPGPHRSGPAAGQPGGPADGGR